MAEEKQEELEEQKIDPPKKQDDPEILRQYLFYIIRRGNWIDEEYKVMAQDYKDSPVEVLRELYLCLCDKVLPGDIKKATDSNDPVKALISVRMNKLQNEYLKPYEERLNSINIRVDNTERIVEEIKGVVNEIPSIVPQLEQYFAETEMTDRRENTIDISNAEIETESASVIDTATNQPDNMQEITVAGKDTLRKKKNSKGLKGRRQRKKMKKEREKRAEFFRNINKDYKKEQLQFLVDCMKQGDSVSDVESYAAPNLPVEVMRSLREQYFREKQEG